MNDTHGQNGVRRRMDGAGDGWASDHRALPRECLLTDCDAFLGVVGFAKNGGDTLFMEYVPDAYRNHGKLIREFGLVALFERKRTPAASRAGGASQSVGLYLWLCRIVASHQPAPPRFFFVFGAASPYEMQEIDINTGLPIGHPKVLPLNSSGWSVVWEELGLMEANRRLSAWLRSK